MIKIRLAQTLRALRRAHNYTQETIAKYLNISRQAYSNYENSKRTPELEMLAKIVDFYQISFDQLLLGHDIIAMEEKGPYHTGLDIVSGDTIFLSERERNLLLSFRDLSSHHKEMTEIFIQGAGGTPPPAEDKDPGEAPGSND